MSSSIRIKKSSTVGALPSSLEVGELALNTGDGLLFYRNTEDSQIHSVSEMVPMACITSDIIKKGSPVYASGGGGGTGKIQVSNFSSDSSGPEEIYFVGVAGSSTSGVSNSPITVIQTGKIHNVVTSEVKESADYSTWIVGTILYVAQTAGKLTSISPEAPDRTIPIAMVVKVNGSHISLYVRYEHGYHIDELHDVSITSPTSGDLLKYDGSKWVNGTVSGTFLDTSSTAQLKSGSLFLGTGADTELNGFSIGVKGVYPIGVVSDAGAEFSITQAAITFSTPGEFSVTTTGSGEILLNSTSINNVGDITTTGVITGSSKNFLIDHPGKPGWKLRHACLEGPENGVYLRGTTTDTIIELPDYWSSLVQEDSITVTLTPVGTFQPLFVVEQNSSIVQIGGVTGEYNYFIQGTRKDVPELVIEEDHREF